MRQYLAILTACLAVSCFPGHPPARAADTRTYHVDDTAGDDARDGLTPHTAWRSLEQVNRAPIGPGDRVLFRRGGAWRGQLVPHSGEPGRPVVYGAYGEGPKPLLLGSTAADRPEDWRPSGDGIWKTVGPRFEPDGTPCDMAGRWSLHREAGAAARLETADGEAGNGFRIVCGQSGSQGHHIQLSRIVPPLVEGAYYRFAFRARATHPFAPARVTLLKNGAPYTHYADAAASALKPVFGTNWTDHEIPFLAVRSADDARITLFLGGALPAGSTLFVQPQSFQRLRPLPHIALPKDVGLVVFDGGAATGAKKWKAEDLREDGDFFYDAAAAQVTLRCKTNPARRFKSIELALTRHIIDEGGRAFVTYEDLDLRCGAAHGIGGGGTRGITVRRCDLSFIGGGLQHVRPDGKPVRYGNGIEFWSDARDCLVEDCRIGEVYDAALTNQGSGTNAQENIAYRRNTIWNCEYSFEYWNRDAASRTRNIRFEHNTCVGAGRGWGHRQRPDPNGRHLMFYSNTADTREFLVRHNIFSDATDSLLRLHGRDWTSALALDGNVWHQPAGPLLLWGEEKIGADGFADFMKQRGFETRGLVADPMFVAPDRHDYRLAPGSPARTLNAGARP